MKDVFRHNTTVTRFLIKSLPKRVFFPIKANILIVIHLKSIFFFIKNVLRLKKDIFRPKKCVSPKLPNISKD